MDLREDGLERVQYDFEDYPIYIRRALLSTYPNYGAASHWHDDVELILILDGEMTYQVNGEAVLLHKGEGIFVNSGQVHFGHSPERQECDFICILFHPNILCANPSTEHKYVHPVTRNADLPYIPLGSGVAWQKKLLKLIEQIYRHKGTKKSPYLKIIASFFEIWDLLYENIADDAATDEIESCDLTSVKDMASFIQENYSNDVSLEDIAKAGGVGQSKCCKLFKRYLGKSPVQYLNQYRLSQGAVLLRHTSLSVTEIALQVGFGGASYFTECFHKWSGLRPLAYRKQHTRGA